MCKACRPGVAVLVGLAKRCRAWLVSRRKSVRFRYGSPLSSKVAVYGESCDFNPMQLKRFTPLRNLNVDSWVVTVGMVSY